MTVIRRDGLLWVAPKDGLAHATAGGLRALCGAIPTPSRYAWPIRDFCAPCTAIATGLKAERRREARIARKSA